MILHTNLDLPLFGGNSRLFAYRAPCQENFRLEKSRQSRRMPHEKRICSDYNDLKPLRVSFCGSLAGESETFYPANSAHSLCRPGLSKYERILRPEILLATKGFGEKREYAVLAASRRKIGCCSGRFRPPAVRLRGSRSLPIGKGGRLMIY